MITHPPEWLKCKILILKCWQRCASTTTFMPSDGECKLREPIGNLANYNKTEHFYKFPHIIRKENDVKDTYGGIHRGLFIVTPN